MIAACFARGSNSSSVEEDVEALLARMRQRFYPETIPVLASYWLKTVCSRSHGLRWWRSMYGLLELVLGEQVLDDCARQSLIDIQTWIRESILLTSRTLPALRPPSGPVRSELSSEGFAPYVGRLLNEWLPVEVARLLVNESESGIQQEAGIPVLAIGRALERLLIRDRLSQGTLENLLQPQLLSPQDVYPADAEIFRDVVLYLLGRTWAEPPSIMPAAPLVYAPGSHFLAVDRQAVSSAILVSRPSGERLHVRIASAQTLEILKRDPVRIGSILVTMDGRWWTSESIESGEQYTIVHVPNGRLRIDNSADHARLRLPGFGALLRWSGWVDFAAPVEI
jgi:hypothetical protein